VQHARRGRGVQRGALLLESQHYDVPINVIGHAEGWDELAIDGDIAARDCAVHNKRAGRVLQVASIHRDVESLSAEVAMERGV
jgi:apoptosis-inducing factor 3